MRNRPVSTKRLSLLCAVLFCLTAAAPGLAKSQPSIYIPATYQDYDG